MSIALTLPPPISANRYWRSYAVKGRAVVVVSAEAEAYKRAVLKHALAAGIHQPIRGRVCLSVQLFPARPLDWAKRATKNPQAWDDTVRSIDLDNALKVLLDALKNVAFDDDSWVRKIEAERMEPDANGGRVFVKVSSISSLAVQPLLAGVV